MLLARLLGAELLGFNIAGLLALRDESGAAQRLIAQGHVVSENVGSVAMLTAKLSGIGNALFWGTIAIYLLFGLGFAYFQLVKPKAA